MTAECCGEHGVARGVEYGDGRVVCPNGGDGVETVERSLNPSVQSLGVDLNWIDWLEMGRRFGI